MAINISETTLNNISNVLEARNPSSQNMFAFDTDGRFKKSLWQPLFMVGHTTAGWVSWPQATWAAQTWNHNYLRNLAANFPLPGSRFTATVAGLYLFNVSHYCIASGGYLHPAVWINGSSTRGTPSTAHSHRIRGHQLIAGGYSFDTNFTELKYMEVGDFAEFYSAAYSAQYYGTYSCFAGYLVA